MTGGTVKSYTYSDTTYKDRLTSYNGQAIIYDTLGNPLSYLGKTLTWTGRELSTYNNSGILTTYKYDSNGIRLSKAMGSVVTDYLYNGSNLIRETKGNDTIWYLYDQNGMIGFELNGTTYYYVRNLQGDVTKILSTSGTTVATYTYDAWGKCTIGTNTGGIADKNPTRYRGYYYDTETGFYYLMSRYYDPEVGRFISSDVVAENGNLYAYCQNDPINRTDENGYWSINWKKVVKIAVVAAVAVATVAVCVATVGTAAPVIGAAIAGLVVGSGISGVTQYVATGTIDLYKVAYDGIIGAVNGVIATTGIGLADSIAMGGLVGGLASVGEDWIDEKVIDPLKMLTGVGIGMVGGAISGKGANVKDGLERIGHANYKLQTAQSSKKIVQYQAQKQAVYVGAMVSAAKTSASIGFGTAINRYIGGLPIWIG